MIKWILIGGILWGIIEAWHIKTTIIKAEDVGLDAPDQPLRIVFISDIHLDTPFGFNHLMMKRVLRMIKKHSPDLVIIGGDLIARPRRYALPIYAYLASLNIECIAVLGNHDYLDLETVKQGYKKHNIKLLVNESLQWHGYTIYGVDDYRKGTPYISQLSSIKAKSILITHEPEVMRKNPYVSQFAFGLAGHHHGGQITCFGLYAPAVRSEFHQDLVKGFVYEQGMVGYVGSGIGGFPMRFFASPEIIVLELKKTA